MASGLRVRGTYRAVGSCLSGLSSKRAAEYRSKSEEKKGSVKRPVTFTREILVRVFFVVFASTALGGLVFQSTTFALPKVIDERFAVSVTDVGWYTFVSLPLHR